MPKLDDRCLCWERAWLIRSLESNAKVGEGSTGARSVHHSGREPSMVARKFVGVFRAGESAFAGMPSTIRGKCSVVRTLEEVEDSKHQR